VQQPCLAYAMITRQEFGIWGGCDENERRLLHRQRREARVTFGEERSPP
jgi:WhiB family redox-sensing transcriptional regulator